MSWMTKVVGLVAVVSMAACAAPASKESAQKTTLTRDAARVVKEEGKVTASTEESEKDSRVVCESVKRVGSHMTESYCYTVAGQERDRQRAQDEIRRAQRGGVRAGGDQ